MKVIIMAGGEGSRLRPLTCDRPKPMVPVLNKPVMEHAIDLLKSYGLTDIGVTLQYLPDEIRDYFGDGSEFGVNMRYFVEEVPLGTAGSVKNAGDFLDETFLVISGDALTDINLAAVIEYHKQRQAMATLVLKSVESPLEYGVVITDNEGRIKQFLEKPSWGEVFSDTVNTGIYVLEPEVLDYFEEGQKFDFSQDLFPMLLKDAQPMYGCVVEGYWCDIGDLQQYQQAHYDILAGKVKVVRTGTEIKPGIWVGTGVEIGSNVTINSPVYIGNGVKLYEGVELDEFSVIGDNTIIDKQGSMKRAILWDNTYIGRKAELRGSVLCNNVQVRPLVKIFEGAVIGDDTVIKEGAVIKPDVKIWPDKLVEKGNIINSSLIWGTKSTKNIFGMDGVTGTVNLEVTPEFAAKLGATYGSIVGENARVIVSSDNYSPSQMIRRSIITGLISSGVKVMDLGKLTTPICRYAVRALEAKGGIHIKLTSEDVEKVCIQFFNDKGANISRGEERKIENMFIREDFKRIAGSRVTEAAEISNMSEIYLNHIIQELEVDPIKAAEMKIVAHYDKNNLDNTIKQLLDELGCQMIYVDSSIKQADKKIRDLPINEYVAKLVVENKADMGVSLDNNGEHITLIDEKGNIINDDMFIALVALIILKVNAGGTVAVPITASRTIEDLAKVHNGKVIRTKTAPQSFMEQVLREEVFSEQGKLSQFFFNFDAIRALSLIMEYVTIEKTSLSELLEAIPIFYLSKKTIDCPWEAKGKVMRTLIEERHDGNIELIDGVKVYHKDGWALVLPDPEDPLCRVYSEGYSQEIAESLTDMYIDKIRHIKNGTKG